MKKYIILLLAASAAMFSCQKSEGIRNNDSTRVYEFSADIDLTKTTIAIDGSEGKINWEAEDAITVTDAGSASAVYEVKSGAGTTSAVFGLKDGETPLGSGPYTAVYGSAPSTSVAQTYSATAQVPVYMTAPSSETTDLTFTAQCGVMKLNLTDATHYVSRIVVSDGSDDYTLNCSSPVSISSATDFFIALPAATYTSIKVTASDTTVATKSPISIAVQNNHIKPVKTSSLVFESGPTVTYYAADGSVVDAEHASFTPNIVWHRDGEMVVTYDGFKIAFCTANGNAIDFNAGDVLEAKIDMSLCQNDAFSFGEEAKFNGTTLIYGDGEVFGASTNSSHNWWGLIVKDNGHKQMEQLMPERGDVVNATLYVRLSKAGGYQACCDGTNWRTAFDATKNPDYHNVLLSRGTSKPLYVGEYLTNQNQITYEYLRVTRSGSPVVPVSVTGVSLSQSSATMTVGDADIHLTATVAPANATDKSVTWSSSDTSVATVSNGTVHAVAAGSATITVTTEDGGFTDTCDVTVNAPIAVTGVTVKSATEIYVGGHETLTATITPSNATNKNVSWSSDSESVATVTSSGVVTAVALGTAHITVTTEDGGHTATCTVTVSAAPVQTGIKYYGQDGTQYDVQPSGWNIQSMGFGPIELPYIDWNNGGYIEIQAYFVSDSGCPLIIGGLGCFYGHSPGIPNGTGMYSLYVWPAGGTKCILHQCTNGANAIILDNKSTSDVQPVTIKISKTKIEYKAEGAEEFTEISSTYNMDFITENPTLYIGSEHNDKSVNSHYNYIKVCLGE